MQIVYFSQKDQFLAEMQSISDELLFVAPSPAKADNLRALIKSTKAVDVITIAKFTSDLLKSLWDEESRPEIKRKAELLLIFGILKNKYFPSLGFEQFNQAYNLFSDLRSFTLDEEALTSVLDEQPEEIKSAVKLFWKLLDLTGFMDEHGAYQKIAEALRSSEEHSELKKTYIFWGFQHLNGQQIDLLKALSIRYHVIIPFPLALKDKLKRSDWPSWLKDHKVAEVELADLPRSPKGKWEVINSREISQRLKPYLAPQVKVVLGVSKLKSQHIEITPHSEVKFKIPHTLLETELVEISEKLESGDVSNFEAWIQEQKKTILSLDTKRQMPFKKLKALQLYEEAYQVIKEMTDEEIKLDYFFRKLLKEVVSLNQPRTSYAPFIQKEAMVELKDMSGIEDIASKDKVILCLDDRFEDIQGLGQNYSESIQKSLAALGPLKRNELELLFKQWEFEDLFSRAEVTVLMSESLLKHSLVWKKLFQGIDLEKVENPQTPGTRPLIDFFKDFSKKMYQGNFSASRIQSYLDCPRKFYFSYVEKLSPEISLEQDIDPLMSGTIIHKIIEEFYHRQLEENQLSELVKEIFDGIITEQKLKLPLDVYLQRQLIFQHRSHNGIKFLKDLEEVVGEKITWKIEEEFQNQTDFKLSGKIDCLGIGSKNIFLLDFKSSKAAASSNTDVESYESIQLWVYALAAQRKIQDFNSRSVSIGYVVLDDPTESNLLFMDEDIFSKVKASKICRPKMLSEEFLEMLKAADEKIIQTVNLIRAEKEYPSRPRSSSACQYCEMATVCVKSELTHV